ncbi:MAG: hypothetical protein ACSLFQ_08690 [Thermoanaerobaculia bacterium]
MPGYRELDSDRIVQTLEQLTKRIEERFPGSSLAGVGRELLSFGREIEGRLQALARPNWPIRALAVLAAALVLTLVVIAIATLQVPTRVNGVVDLAQGIESAINDVIFLGLGLWFLLTIETRLKRRAALKALHELRSIAHIVDMHQLTKDPEQVLNPGMNRTASSPARAMSRFQLARYLDYCSELLSLVGKLASLHAQHLPDPVILEAVNEIESLSVGLARKIWQKIVILDTIGAGSGPDQR